MKIMSSSFIALICFLLSTHFVFASNVGFLNYSAISFFQGQDKNMMVANVYKALNHSADGQKSAWKNPKTGSYGFAVPSNTTKRNGMVCRDLKIFNSAHQVTGAESYQFCKYNNEWRIMN